MSPQVASCVKLAIALAAAMTVSSIACARDDSTALEPDTLAATTDNLNATAAEVLKSEYLTCERAAAQARPDFATGIRCSILYEELRQRVFGGSFDDLISWWRSNKDTGPASR